MTLAAPMSLLAVKPALRVQPIAPVAVYGTLWSFKAHRICRYLRQEHIFHRYVDLDLNPDAEELLRRACPDGMVPPVVYVDGDWLVSPGIQQLEDALVLHGLTVSTTDAKLTTLQ